MIDLEQIGFFLFMEQQEQEQKRQKDALKEEYTMNEENKAVELTDEDLKQVSGGNTTPDCYKPVPRGVDTVGCRKSTCSGCSYILKCLNSMTTISPFMIWSK